MSIVALILASIASVFGAIAYYFVFGFGAGYIISDIDDGLWGQVGKALLYIIVLGPPIYILYCVCKAWHSRLRKGKHNAWKTMIPGLIIAAFMFLLLR